MTVQAKLKALEERWAGARPAERANAQSYLRELAEALNVEVPRPAGSGYEFEYAVRVVGRDGTQTTNFIDLYKTGHFALEAKDEAAGPSPDLLLRKAFGQLRSYIGHLPDERPPYLLVLDVGKSLLVWDRWLGGYGDYPATQRIDFRSLSANPEAIALLRDIWDDPAARDPRGRAAQVTKEIAGRLAELAASLEGRGHDQEQVARFLIRCVFTMFAEDIDLLPDAPFRQLIDRVALAHPEQFPGAVERWQGQAAATPLQHVVAQIRAVLNDPVHQWVSIREAGRILGKSEETIRRWCRQDRGEFRFRQIEQSGRYEIWLADLTRKDMLDAA